MAIALVIGGLAIVALVFLGGSTALGSTGSTGSAASDTAGTGTAAGSASGVGATATAIMTYLMGQGLTRVAAAGVVGNLQQESSLNPNEGGGGLAQWQAPRGPSDWSLAGQLQYLVSDLKGNYAGLLSQMNNATSAGDAAVLFSDTYEKPGTPMLQNRINYATAAYGAG